ncbi:LiaF transmembrane domain-containing protein [Lacticaseibacillus mingshuiensis]|uniref:LiaF transmembrane domain-containing protein n=1 Tax=Lacticaseibacillus mingshuiensis TaxID=2799574 RepID=A0ABW4CG72_9LACO|nr:hypothetical protein [Lacticaseibacillus mingshuiensis]
MSTNSKWSQWFWGLFFLASAVVLIGSQMGWFTLHLTFWQIVFGLILSATFFQSIGEISAPGIVFSLAFLAILFAHPLGITRLVPWTILGAALLLSIGLSMILSPLQKRDRSHGLKVIVNGSTKIGDSTETIAASEDQLVKIHVRLGNAVRYVQLPDFRAAQIDMQMGDAKIYFDGSEIPAGEATIDLDAKMGELELFVPRDWRIDNQLQTFAAELTEKGTQADQLGPVVHLTGRMSMGELTVHYI